jgi:hypothetical protein
MSRSMPRGVGSPASFVRRPPAVRLPAVFDTADAAPAGARTA